MHDPKTVAFEIYLGSKKKRNGNYKSPFITIWHNDPELDGSDDSCGWSYPKITNEEITYLDKVAKEQYGQLFARRIAIAEDKDYFSICYDQDIYGVIYWMWRVFNKKFNKTVWQYGNDLTLKELQQVYVLSTNPVDNFQHNNCHNIAEFRDTIGLIYRVWKRFHRKWYQHPRWHIHHWSIQFHPYQRLKRRYFDKCSECGKRGFKGAAYSDWDGTKTWHEECNPNKSV